MIDRRFVIVTALAALLGGLLVAAWASRQEDRYGATATLAIGPSPQLVVNAELIDVVSALDGGTAPATLAAIATSRSVQDGAASAIDIDPAALDDYAVDATPVLTASLVDVHVSGPDPESTSAFVNAIADNLTTTFPALYPVYTVDVVTVADPEADTERPSVVLLFVAGAVCAGLLAALLMSLRRRSERPAAVVHAVGS